MKILICDGVGGCGKEFFARVHVREVEGDIEEKHFSCPHCKKVFHINYTNISTKKLQKEIKALRRKYEKARSGDSKAAPKIFEQISSIEKVLREEMLKLENKYRTQATE